MLTSWHTANLFYFPFAGKSMVPKQKDEVETNEGRRTDGLLRVRQRFAEGQERRQVDRCCDGM